MISINIHIQRVREMGHVEEAEKSLTFLKFYKSEILSDPILSFLSSLHTFIIGKFQKVVQSTKRMLKITHNSNTFFFPLFLEYKVKSESLPSSISPKVNTSPNVLYLRVS